MRILVDSREIEEIPLVERSLWVDNSYLIVEYSVVGDLNANVSFRREFTSHDDALKSAAEFVGNKVGECDLNSSEAGLFSDRQISSKISLFEAVANNKMRLPENGVGFLYDGDVDYLKKIIAKLKSREKDVGGNF
jgi:hypothetical protein